MGLLLKRYFLTVTGANIENNIVHILKSVEENTNSAFFYKPAQFVNSVSYYFENPRSIIKCTEPSDLDNKLNEIEYLKKSGLFGYGIIAYETSYLLEERLKSLLPRIITAPFMQFYFYDPANVSVIKTDELNFSAVPNILKKKQYQISNLKVNTTENEYISSINKIKNYICEGDTYQVNYTVKCNFNFSGNLADLFLNLIFNQSAEYTSIINVGNQIIMSISPELFFKKNVENIITKPMKGTIKRGLNTKDDMINKNILLNSEKDRAENVMIVDLLRNDFGKISRFGSVNVKSLFDIEKYETLYQMTSEIESRLNNDNFPNIIKNIFPCGSITGAPKIRTMEIISELEKEPRGIYTGSIGLFTPEEDIFNVAIRTISINNNTSYGEIGIGSGIVWDSDPIDEYNETLLKSRFLTNPDEYFELFETLLWENDGYFLFDYHLKRIKESADFMLFIFNENKFISELQTVSSSFNKTKSYKVKATLTKWGAITIEAAEFFNKNNPVKIIISQNRISVQNKFQYFKTTNRNMYETESTQNRNEGYYETLYLNEKENIAEGSFTNLFLKKGKDWFTPPIGSGILNGCYRRYLLDNHPNYHESELKLPDLIDADHIMLTNSLRKEIHVNEVWSNNKIIKSIN